MAFGLMDSANSPSAGNFMEAVSPMSPMPSNDSWSLAKLEQQLALQRYIQENLSGASTNSSASSIINLPPAQKPYPFKPISTILDPWNRYRPVKPVGPIDDTPKKEPDPIEGGDGIHTRDVPFAWESALGGAILPGAGMTNPKTGLMDGFKSAIGNAKIGLTGNIGMFTNPLDDPGWQSVMAANGFTRQDFEPYFSLPGQPMPSNYGEALKQHEYMGLRAMDNLFNPNPSKNPNYNSVFDAKTSSTQFKDGKYSFDRASYMDYMNKVSPEYVKSVTSVNNASAAATMYGAMALKGVAAGTPFSSVAALNAMPSYAFDILNAMSAHTDISNITNNARFSNMLDSLSPTQLFQYKSELKNNPNFAASQAKKEETYKLMVDSIKSGEGISGFRDTYGLEGLAISEAAKDRLGISKDMDFGSAIGGGVATTDQVLNELARGYGLEGSFGSDGGSDGGRDHGGNGPSGDGNGHEHESGFSDAPGGNMEDGYR